MIKFSFGSKRPDPKKIALVSVLMAGLVASLSQCSGVPSEALWDALDEAQRRWFPQTIINDVIIKDPDKLDRRIKRDVDHAIEDYKRLTGYSEVPIIPLPKEINYSINKDLCYSEACRSLGGEMRLCAPWVEDCVVDTPK